MRVIILTDSAERHYYFANRIFEQAEWDAKVILCGKTLNVSYKEKIGKILGREPLKWLKKNVWMPYLEAMGRACALKKKR